jgi:oligosaccharide repeat unit polymerase
MDLVFNFTLAISIVIALVHLKKTGDYANPSSLILVFFVIPLVANRFQLSGLTADVWLDETYLVICYFLIFFIIIPSLVVLFREQRYSILKVEKVSKKIKINKIFLIFMVIFSIVTQFILNKVASGYFFPILNMHQIGSGYHVATIPIVGIFFVVSWYFTVVLMYVKARQANIVLYYIIFFIILCLPLIRLARFDLINVLFMIFILSLVESKRPGKLIIKLSALTSALFVLGAMVATYRWSQAGLHEVSFSKIIDFNVYAGPMDVFAFLYAYFPLSFENIDRFIIKNLEHWDYAYGAFSTRPIGVGLLKLHYFDGFPFTQHFNEMRDPLIGVATVSTVIPAFTVDFGVYLSFIPMALYSGIGLYLYLKSRGSIHFFILYLFYSTSYIMSSFQNTFIQANFIYLLILYVSAVKLKAIRFNR